jgi:hypothetical protein
MTRIGEIGTTLAVTSNGRTLRSSETLVLTRATRRNIPEDGILHSHRREEFKDYMGYILFINIIWKKVFIFKQTDTLTFIFYSQVES